MRLASFGALFQFGGTNIVYRKRTGRRARKHDRALRGGWRVEARPWRRAGLGKAENNDDDGDSIGEGGGGRDEGEKRRAAARNAARERARRRERERREGEGERGATSSSSSSSGGGGGFRRGQVTGRESRAARSVDRTKLPPMPRGGGDDGGDCDGGSITPCRALTMANESERTLPLLILLPLLTLYTPVYHSTLRRGTKKDRKRRGRFGLIVVVFNAGQGGERVYDRRDFSRRGVEVAKVFVEVKAGAKASRLSRIWRNRNVRPTTTVQESWEEKRRKIAPHHERTDYSSEIKRVITFGWTFFRPRCDDRDGDEVDERVRVHFPSRGKRVSSPAITKGYHHRTGEFAFADPGCGQMPTICTKPAYGGGSSDAESFSMIDDKQVSTALKSLLVKYWHNKTTINGPTLFIMFGVERNWHEKLTGRTKVTNDEIKDISPVITSKVLLGQCFELCEKIYA
ncbi:hypothetical protein ALC53_07768 [Atta colombica]|uniref:Uncharacterized protein n=1 Tax=Atta colombica TaxID=520822 RepID=A0A195BC55_9HYME|nr:hypothetical protein ALC53_07768 [Atta colombica]